MPSGSGFVRVTSSRADDQDRIDSARVKSLERDVRFPTQAPGEHRQMVTFR